MIESDGTIMPDPLRRLGIPLTTLILAIFAFGVAWTKHNEGMMRIDRVETQQRELDRVVQTHTALLERIDERTSRILQQIKGNP